MFKYAVEYLKNTFYPLSVPDTLTIEDGQMVLVRTSKGEEALRAFVVNSKIIELWEKSENKPEALSVIRTLSQRDLQTLDDIKKEEVEAEDADAAAVLAGHRAVAVFQRRGQYHRPPLRYVPRPR